jgi:hypothetical protein
MVVGGLIFERSAWLSDYPDGGSVEGDCWSVSWRGRTFLIAFASKQIRAKRLDRERR